jgi:uncharacterized protein
MQKNLFRVRKIGQNILAVTDQGKWCFLSEHQLKRIDNNSFAKRDLDFFEGNNLLVTDNNISGIIKSQRKNYLHLFLGTSLHIIVPTERCNHKCLYCHSSAKNPDASGFDMDIETAKKTVDFIFQSPSNSITIEFQGGEPLLNFETVRYIIEYAKEKNKEIKKDLRFSLVSNLSLMDHDILKYLIKSKIGLCTSLDGPEKVHNKNRIMLGGNAYKNVTYWIKEIKKNYNYPINALMVTTKHSLAYPEEIVDEYLANGLDWIKFRHLDLLGYAGANKSLDYSAEQYFDFWLCAIKHIIKINKRQKFVEGFIRIIMQKLNGIHPNYSDFESPCGAIISQLAYSHNGDIYTCDEGRQYELFKLGNVKVNSYNEILNSEQAREMISCSVNDSLFCDNCAYKPFCGVCPVCTFSEEDSLIPKIPTNKRCKIYKKTFDYIFSCLSNDKEASSVFYSWLK